MVAQLNPLSPIIAVSYSVAGLYNLIHINRGVRASVRV